MGFFKDINTVHKQAKEIDKTFDAGQSMRDANAKMRAMNDALASANKAAAGAAGGTGESTPASAQVMSVGMTMGVLNTDPIVPVELLVLAPGLPPRPVSLSLVVPVTQLHRLQAGATLPVLVSVADPSAVAVDWAQVT